MNKAIETMLTIPSARNRQSIKTAAFSKASFTPWEGDLTA